MNTTTFASVVAAIVAGLEMAVRIAVLVLIASVLMSEFGVRVLSLPRPQPQTVAFLAGAWFLYKGGRV